jgi:hypothetical protein
MTMKRQWTYDELAEHWTLLPEELKLLANKTGATRLGWLCTAGYHGGSRHEVACERLQSSGSPSSAKSCSMRWAVQRWRSSSRSQPRLAASSVSPNSRWRRLRKRGAYSLVVTNLAQLR